MDGAPLSEIRVTAALGAAGLATRLTARGHEFLADEPADVGGADGAPTPHELVLGGLGACTAITLRLYAERKGWPLEGVEVDLELDRTLGARPRITERLRLLGPLAPDQRARLREIAARCPVHLTLAGGADIDTRLEG